MTDQQPPPDTLLYELCTTTLDGRLFAAPSHLIPAIELYFPRASDFLTALHKSRWPNPCFYLGAVPSPAGDVVPAIVLWWGRVEAPAPLREALSLDAFETLREAEAAYDHCEAGRLCAPHTVH